MRWRIFPCHSIVQTDSGPACSCGRASCTSPGKHPRTKAGFKDATCEEAQIRRWWARWNDANIGLATGSGLTVIDIDGPAGAAEFKALVAEHGAIPETLTAATGRGLHLVFRTREGPEVRSSARGNVHVRGEGGYIIVAPSQHISGKTYTWIRRHETALLPDWLRQWSQGYDITHKIVGLQNLDHLGPLPDHLSRSSNRSEIDQPLKEEYSPSEEMRIKSALSAIPADAYESWVQVGMALKALDWQRSDGTEIGFDLWLDWSEKCPEKFSHGVCADKWQSFKRSGVTVGTIYHLAQQHGWNGGAPPVGEAPAQLARTTVPHKEGQLNGNHSGPQALPAAFLGAPIFFPDRTEEGKPRPTMTNAKVAILALGLDCRYDLFHNRKLVAGELIGQWHSPELSDDVVTMLRDVIRYRFGFDPKKENTYDACETLCLSHRFDPILDYLDRLKWDGVPRIERWLTTYMGADDTPLNRQFGQLSLIAAVRRARSPGTKFDQITVLEGPEGKGKSDAIRALAGSENFSDQKILGADDKTQQELLEGVWLYEIAELTGISKVEIEHVKAFASRTVDRTRPAYGRFRVDRPRRTVFFATTNRNDYLISDTGNRRFWPVVTTTIDVEGIRRDRGQLWAEAAHLEAAGASIVLPERFWTIAGEVQDQRLARDAWLDAINNYVNMADKIKQDVSTWEVLVDNQFIQRKPDQVGRHEQMRAGSCLRQLGFERYHQRVGKTFNWRYRRVPEA